MNVIKKIHAGWTEYQNTDEKFKNSFKPIFHKWQYIYKDDDMSISLVKFERFYDEAPWEIYQLTGKSLFDDVERFKTKKDAEKRIKELFGIKDLHERS